MKIYSCYSRSHKILWDNFFLPSLPKDVKLVSEYHPQICESAWLYSENWVEAVRKKILFIMNAIEQNMGKIFVFSDCDVQFFGSISEQMKKELSDFDLAFQSVKGAYCTGFFACRGSKETYGFFKDVYDAMPTYGGDQRTVNSIFHKYPNIKMKTLSERFWTHTEGHSEPPKDILVYHANCSTFGIENKIILLSRVRDIIKERSSTNVTQSPLACCSSHTEVIGPSKNLFGVEYLFNQLNLDVDWMIDIGSKSEISESFPASQRIWVHVEPEPYTWYFDNFEEYYQGGIFSWHPRVENLPQFKKIRIGIRGVEPLFTTDKKFGISGLVSNKCAEWSHELEQKGYAMEGYRLRRTILEKEKEIKIPSFVWNFTKKWNGQTHEYPVKMKTTTMDHMFHFAVENCLEKNYFTEKITDCFMTCCVPIYFGDANAVSEYFNMDGVIVANENDWLDKVNSLTEKDYYDRLPAMEDNLFRVLIFLHDTMDVYKDISRIILKDMKK